jgi:transcriptional regulator with XRE-family HTH domain
VHKLTPPKIKALGRNVARLRNQANLSQERLAELTEIHTRFLQKVEGGQLGASLAVLIRLKKALKCSWDDLLAGIG